MAPPASLRDWIALLEREGELVRIDAEVDPHLEVTEIVDRTVKANGPALLFANPKGSSHPLLINQFGTERRMCLAFDAPSLDSVAGRLEEVLEMQPPQGLVDKVKGLKKLKSIADSQPKSMRSGPSQEVVLTGDDVDLSALPVQTCWPGDAAPFITLPAVITKDPRTGGRNVGMYRMQVLDRRSTAMHWQIHKDGRADYLLADGKLEVAVALGLDPVTAYAASAPLPKHVDELMLAGFLRGEPVELVPGKTVDLEVPANAEIVLEGYIAKDDLTTEGPFGDHTGYYTLPEPYPVFHVTAITHRKDAVYPATIVGIPPMEDFYIGGASVKLFLPIFKMNFPEIVDIALPAEGVFHNLVFVSIRKTYPMQAYKIMHGLWGMGQMMFTKYIIVVDDDVDVHNTSEVLFRLCANTDPQRDSIFTKGPSDVLDHATSEIASGSKLGIDATKKIPGEGFKRPWPPLIKMDAV